jgi:hypothetical protein
VTSSRSATLPWPRARRPSLACVLRAPLPRPWLTLLHLQHIDVSQSVTTGKVSIARYSGRTVADHSISDHHRGLRQLGHQLSASFRLPRPLVGAPSRFRLGLVTPSRHSRFPSVTLPLSPSPAWAALGRALNARFDDSTPWALAAALTACQPDLIPQPGCAHALAAECSTGREHVPRPFEQAEPHPGAAVRRASQVDTASGARLCPSASG